MALVVTPFNLVNIEDEAEALLKAARARAGELLRLAVQEAEKVREQARAEGAAIGRQQGRQQGLDEGRAQGLQEERARAAAAVPDALRAIAALADGLRDQRDALLHGAERDLLKLACAIAARVTRAEVARDPLVVQRAVHDVIVLAAARRQLVLRVHPDDDRAVRDYLPELQKIFADLEGVSLVADAAVTRGGCLAALPTGSVDAQIETQLAQIEAALLGEPEPPHTTERENR